MDEIMQLLGGQYIWTVLAVFVPILIWMFSEHQKKNEKKSKLPVIRILWGVAFQGIPEEFKSMDVQVTFCSGAGILTFSMIDIFYTKTNGRICHFFQPIGSFQVSEAQPIYSFKNINIPRYTEASKILGCSLRTVGGVYYYSDDFPKELIKATLSKKIRKFTTRLKGKKG